MWTSVSPWLGASGPGPAVPLSVADLKDGDGGVVDIPSTWRAAVKRSDAESETVEITTENQRWARWEGNVGNGNVRRAQARQRHVTPLPSRHTRRASDAIGSKGGGVALTRGPDDLLKCTVTRTRSPHSSSMPLHAPSPFLLGFESLRCIPEPDLPATHRCPCFRCQTFEMMHATSQTEGSILTQTEAASGQGLTLVPISAQLELFCPPCNPTKLMNVSWICSS
jgi:hypothetical protein